jgi:poly [ADP-ribose] polymerase
MEGGAYAYLVCVDGSPGVNSNKFYKMEQISPSEFRATWGREDSNRKPQSKVFSMYRWDELYNKRVNKRSRKSYTDVTELRAVEVVADSNDQPASVSAISDSRIRQLFASLQGFATGSVRRNYKVSSEAVTQAQIDRAQYILDQISGLVYTPDTRADNWDVNELLEDLYTVVPRKMAKVSDHLLPYSSGLEIDEAKRLFQLEQANIDVMAGQVRANARASAPAPQSPTGKSSILDSMGITMRLATADEARAIRNMTQGDGRIIGTVFAVENAATRGAFDGHLADVTRRKGAGIHTRTAQYWHGSRNENWLNILDTGLLIRPPMAQSTGDMFGIGIYFADKFKKSMGYTSYHGSYWAGGRSDRGYMAVFDVHIGKQYEVGRHSHSCYDLSAEKLHRLGQFDSTWGKSGYSLVSNEYIVYSPQQCTVAYLVELV